jgi:hypothetical protein
VAFIFVRIQQRLDKVLISDDSIRASYTLRRAGIFFRF